METIIEMLNIAVLPVVVAIILYILEKKTAFKNVNATAKQIICGLIFGGLAIIGTEFGVDLNGAIANTRDASVLIAGLIFGSPAGIISGLIGGIERYLCVYWGGGQYTRIACSISTIIAGIFGALLRKYMFEDKKPSILYALAIGIVTEVMHMLMIFFTNMSDITTAFSFVKKCSIPMISVNGISVMLAVLFVSLLGKEKDVVKKSKKQIASVAQQWLLVCVINAFLLTCFFTSALQIQISENNTNELLHLNIQDVIADISDASNRNILSVATTVANEIENGYDIHDVASTFGIAEINVVDDKGIITDSTYLSFIGYDMASGEQSAEFMVLLEGEKSYVQSYRPISYDNTVYRKYAGVVLKNGGFIQVGYDAKNFQEDIASQVLDATINRHIGKSGYLLIADENGLIVSGKHSGENIFNTPIGDAINSGVKADESFISDVFDEKAYCMYQLKEGYYGIAILPENEATFSRDISIYMMVFMEIVIFGALFILIYFLIRKLVVDNIKSVNNSLAEITKGNLDVVVNVRSNEEFASLSDDINSTVDTLKKLIAEAAARIDKELEHAKVIQESTLPSLFPPFPDKKELDIFASMNPAKEVGGDFYDFYLLDDDHLAFLVADVSGKGITGAMFMMKSKTVIKNFAEQGKDVSQIITEANNVICEGNDAEMFVTCFMGIIDLKNNKMEYTNAGHNPPLIKRKDGKYEYFKTKHDFVLGGMDSIKYHSGEVDFNKGDSIFIYTDGVTEATDINNELYGEDRLYNALNSAEVNNCQELCHFVKVDVDKFVADAPQFDDITMLCIKIKED